MSKIKEISVVEAFPTAFENQAQDAGKGLCYVTRVADALKQVAGRLPVENGKIVINCWLPVMSSIFCGRSSRNPQRIATAKTLYSNARLAFWACCPPLRRGWGCAFGINKFVSDEVCIVALSPAGTAGGGFCFLYTSKQRA